jgi:hypothetical protein
MGRPKSNAPTRDQVVPVRLFAAEREYIEAAIREHFKAAEEGVDPMPLGTFARSSMLVRSRDILGMSLDEWQRQREPAAPAKDRPRGK